MIKGHIAALQRDHAWDGFSKAERKAGQSEGIYDPFQTPEQTKQTESFESRQEREDVEYSRSMNSADADRGRQARGAGAARLAEEVASDRQKRDKEALDRAELLSRAQNLANYYGGIADGYEDKFEAMYGDAWRETIALKVLGEDEYPERQPGESLEDYRQRIEEALIDKMIDKETGQIKPEYADDPEKSEYAKWALSRFKQRDIESKAEIAADTSRPGAERDEALNDLRSATDPAALQVGDQQLGVRGYRDDVISEKIDAQRQNADAQSAVELGANAFS
ncbi:hypothetical protein FF098_015890 [Parvularcula flava]|uniref:Uncharacterized protein n=1 Tax=Aquisalinus luteolus TaxID=1566827 RepID=A0A8J3A4H8_9PROT|nr:hypothetical protein [Aquisalinus luteolus]NHK29397.1 hypothetical protein [Aquisalinus luteolus]GGI02073.1 hypothetical protein GCM10011355_34220 [Aquisalinus luteolus]